jgi:hypothetical protein
MKMAAAYMDSNDPSPPSGETPNSRSMKSIRPPMLPAWYLIHDFVQVNNAGRCAIVSRAHHLASEFIRRFLLTQDETNM